MSLFEAIELQSFSDSFENRVREIMGKVLKKATVGIIFDLLGGKGGEWRREREAAKTRSIARGLLYFWFGGQGKPPKGAHYRAPPHRQGPNGGVCYLALG